MYQYGNVAAKYQKENKNRPNIYKQPNRIPQPKKKPNVQIQQQAAPKQKIIASEKIIYLLGIILVVATLCLLLMGRATIVELNYEVQFLEKEYVTIHDRNSELRTEVAKLSSPDRILDIARNVWGLEVNESPVKVLSSPAVKVASATEYASDTEATAVQEFIRTSRGEEDEPKKKN